MCSLSLSVFLSCGLFLFVFFLNIYIFLFWKKPFVKLYFEGALLQNVRDVNHLVKGHTFRIMLRRDSPSTVSSNGTEFYLFFVLFFFYSYSSKFPFSYQMLVGWMQKNNKKNKSSIRP